MDRVAHGGRLVVQVNLDEPVGVERGGLRLEVRHIDLGQVHVGVVDPGSATSGSLAARAVAGAERAGRLLGTPWFSASSLASRTPASLSSRRMDRPSAGVRPAWSKAVLSSARDR